MTFLGSFARRAGLKHHPRSKPHRQPKTLGVRGAILAPAWLIALTLASPGEWLESSRDESVHVELAMQEKKAGDLHLWAGGETARHPPLEKDLSKTARSQDPSFWIG